MKTTNFILGIVPTAVEAGSKAVGMNSLAWYAIGALIALFLLGYLVYALIKPEEF
jgi:K+-transporting ATPase KdpF subunit